ncbi:MAG: radical SAM protein, partial [Thermodesulfobacteriota bacterium]
IADGCLYNCGFCRVKSGNGFSVRTRRSITDQLHSLKQFYGRDLVNYNSVFLGEHDALFAGAETVCYAAEKAFEILEIENSVMKEPRLFLFGSADAILRTDDEAFARLNRLPFFIYINIGLESGDPETLAYLKKPLSTEKVSAAFSRMIEINRRFPNIEISANFVIGEDLPDAHLPSIVSLTRNRLDHFYPKGDIYLSPLENIGAKEDLLSAFNQFKTLCRLPAYLYLIQRL